MDNGLLLEALSKLSDKDKQIKIEKTIDDGRTRNYLLRCGVRTIGDLEDSFLQADKKNLDGMTEYCMKVIIESISEFLEREEDAGREMFTNMLPEYDHISIEAINLIIKDRRPIGKLLDEGYKDIGSLRGIPEKHLEELTTPDVKKRFYKAEEYLSKSPEEWLSQIWKNNLDDRKQRILTDRADGLTCREIGIKEGISTQRVSQISCKFYWGQDAILEAIENKIAAEKDRETALNIVFSDKMHRDIFIVWEKIRTEVGKEMPNVE